MKHKSVGMILFLIFLYSVGMNFHHPITPTLFSELNLPSYIFGTSFAVMCLFSFLFSMYWGDKVNVIGRVKVFALCSIMYAFGQYCLSIANNELFIYVGRAVSGSFSGGCAVASLTYLIDISPLEKRGTNIAISTAIITASGTLGFLLGGIIGNSNYMISLYVQIIWMVSVGIIALLFLEETYINKGYRSKSNINPFVSFINMKKYMDKALFIILFVVFFANFATSSYDNSFNYYLKAVLDLTPISNGIFKFVFGLVGLCANMTINIYIVRKLNVNFSLMMTLLLCALFPIGSLLSNNMITFVLFNVLFFAVNSIYQPLLQTVGIKDRFNEDVSNITGIINSIKSLGMVCGSSIAGFVFDYNHDFPFMISIVMFLFATIVCYFTIKSSVKVVL